MDTFDHLLNWKLKAGSHPFPGKEGGTCINEAALVAAGFDYSPIRTADDMPECFSRPICHFAMLVNDEATDDERQRLLPYVTRLACADIQTVENARAAYIASRMVRRMSFEDRLTVLEGALAIGWQADPFPANEVKCRMEVVQAGATTLTSVPDTPLFAKIQSWFWSEAETERTS